jgi:hypothetical protein
MILYDYAIEIKPDVSKKGRERARVFEALQDNPAFQPYINDIAHDSAQRLITHSPLPDDLVIDVRIEESRGATDPPKVTDYQVSFPSYNELSTSDLER